MSYQHTVDPPSGESAVIHSSAPVEKHSDPIELREHSLSNATTPALAADGSSYQDLHYVQQELNRILEFFQGAAPRAEVPIQTSFQSSEEIREYAQELCDRIDGAYEELLQRAVTLEETLIPHLKDLVLNPRQNGIEASALLNSFVRFVRATELLQQEVSTYEKTVGSLHTKYRERIHQELGFEYDGMYSSIPYDEIWNLERQIKRAKGIFGLGAVLRAEEIEALESRVQKLSDAKYGTDFPKPKCDRLTVDIDIEACTTRLTVLRKGLGWLRNRKAIAETTEKLKALEEYKSENKYDSSSPLYDLDKKLKEHIPEAAEHAVETLTGACSHLIESLNSYTMQLEPDFSLSEEMIDVIADEFVEEYCENKDSNPADREMLKAHLSRARRSPIKHNLIFPAIINMQAEPDETLKNEEDNSSTPDSLAATIVNQGQAWSQPAAHRVQLVEQQIQDAQEKFATRLSFVAAIVNQQQIAEALRNIELMQAVADSPPAVYTRYTFLGHRYAFHDVRINSRPPVVKQFTEALENISTESMMAVLNSRGLQDLLGADAIQESREFIREKARSDLEALHHGGKDACSPLRTLAALAQAEDLPLVILASHFVRHGGGRLELLDAQFDSQTELATIIQSLPEDVTDAIASSDNQALKDFISIVLEHPEIFHSKNTTEFVTDKYGEQSIAWVENPVYYEASAALEAMCRAALSDPNGSEDLRHHALKALLERSAALHDETQQFLVDYLATGQEPDAYEATLKYLTQNARSVPTLSRGFLRHIRTIFSVPEEQESHEKLCTGVLLHALAPEMTTEDAEHIAAFTAFTPEQIASAAGFLREIPDSALMYKVQSADFVERIVAASEVPGSAELISKLHTQAHFCLELFNSEILPDIAQNQELIFEQVAELKSLLGESYAYRPLTAEHSDPNSCVLVAPLQAYLHEASQEKRLELLLYAHDAYGTIPQQFSDAVYFAVLRNTQSVLALEPEHQLGSRIAFQQNLAAAVSQLMDREDYPVLREALRAVKSGKDKHALIQQLKHDLYFESDFPEAASSLRSQRTLTLLACYSDISDDPIKTVRDACSARGGESAVRKRDFLLALTELTPLLRNGLTNSSPEALLDFTLTVIESRTTPGIFDQDGNVNYEKRSAWDRLKNDLTAFDQYGKDFDYTVFAREYRDVLGMLVFAARGLQAIKALDDSQPTLRIVAESCRQFSGTPTGALTHGLSVFSEYELIHSQADLRAAMDCMLTIDRTGLDNSDAWNAVSALCKATQDNIQPNIVEIQSMGEFFVRFGTYCLPALYAAYRELERGDEPSESLQALGVTLTGKSGIAQLSDAVRTTRRKLLQNETIEIVGDVQKEILIALTRFEESSWARSSNSFEKMVARFNYLQEHGEIAPASEHYFEAQMAVKKLDAKAIADVKITRDTITKISELRQDIAETRDKEPAVVLSEQKEELKYRIDREIEALSTPISEADEPDAAQRARRIAGRERKVEQLQTILQAAQRAESIRDLVNILALAEKKDNPITTPTIRKLLVYSGLSSLGSNDAILAQCEGPVSKHTISVFTEFFSNVLKEELVPGLKLKPRAAKRVKQILSVKMLHEELDRFRSIATRGTDDFTIVPSRGIMGELSGYICDACWTSRSDVMKLHPNITPLIFVRNRGKSTERLAGAAMLIQTKDESGEDVLILRGVNPLQTYITQVDAGDFYEQLADYAAEVAQRLGVKKVLSIMESSSGAAMTNRPDICSHVVKTYKHAPRVKLASAVDSTFNGYNISDKCVLTRNLE